MLPSNNTLFGRTLRRVAQAGVILLVFYVILIGGFVLGVREYRWQLTTTVILGLLWSGWFWRKWRVSPPSRTGLELPLLLMLIASILATIFSTDLRLSAGRLALNFILTVSLYFTLDWLHDDRWGEWLINALLLIGAVVCLVGLIEYWQWYGGSWVAPVSQSEAGVAWTFRRSLRIKSVLHNPNYLAYFLLLPMALGFYKLFQAKTFRPRGGWAGYLLLTMVTMVLTKSRGGLLGALVITITAVALFLWPRLRDRSLLTMLKRPRQILLLILVLVVVAVLFFPILSRTNLDSNATFSLRDDIWQGAIDIFLHQPLLGAGPATYPTQYFIYRNPAGHTSIFTHAHNVWLTIAAEYGLLGLLSVGGFFCTLVVMVGRYLRRTPPQRWSAMLLGGSTLLAGQGMHNLVDDFMEFPIFSWFTVLAVAMCLRPIQAEFARPAMSKPVLWGWRLVVIAGAIAVLGGAGWHGRAFAAYEQARTASTEGDWPQAVQWLEQAVAIDPGYRFYRQQLALAYGELTAIDSHYVEAALTQQRQVVQHSHYAPDDAYLGCLFWRLDQPGPAIDWMKKAAAITPERSGGLYSYHLGQATFYFNLGYYLEQSDRPEAARNAYRQLLQARPPVGTSVYWQLSPLRQQVVPTVQPYRADYYLAWEALAAGDLSQAEAVAKQGQARASAEHAPPYHYLRGRVAEMQGNLPLAIESYQLAVAGSTTIRTDYANLVGQRQPLATEKPFCLMIPYPAEYLSEPSLALGRLHQAQGSVADAAAAYQNLLKYEPYNPQAQRQLVEILPDGSP